MQRRSLNLRKALLCLFAGMCLGKWPNLAADSPNVSVDLSRYSPTCGVQVRAQAGRLEVSWPMGPAEKGRVSFSLIPGKPLIETLAIAKDATSAAESLLHGVDPVTFLTVGTREAPSGRPP